MLIFLPSEEFPEQTTLLSDKYDIAFTAEPVDERGQFSKKISLSNSNSHVKISYHHDTLAVELNGLTENLINFLDRKDVYGAKSILFDATNLSFAEIVIVLRLALTTGTIEKVAFIYTEPESYSSKIWTPLEIRGFELSNKINALDFIPRFYQANSSNKNYLLVFQGFESTRFSRLIDPDEGEPYSKLSVAFSVPPFQTGWETHALMANSQIFNSNKVEEIFFIPGNQPYEAYQLINETFNVVLPGYETNLTLAPFGTKPTSIAVALAAAENEKISVLFDFPTKKTGRSSGIGPSHHYPVLLK
ncbi:hypothetical protein [Nitrosomonas ureae]|uniref:Uncharacterized protein n=1 Tax=Nitrosomonas ureae TaxID=44577 RepID=A0A1H2HMT9_9PROT|nr:hypothetical protein [Nitrosomonas ureae]SDU33187.1 hypothetical protein SAMN05216406_1566 [Nitrosomonas ureae]